MPDRNMKTVMEAIRRHRRFMVSSHVNPEGDALGSALALASLLKRLGKKVVLGQEGGVPSGLAFLPRTAPIFSRPNGHIQAEVSMIVDVPVLHRVGSFQKMIRQMPLVVNIDHHVSNQRFADINWVDPKAASVGEMIYRLCKAFGLSPTRQEALCMYVSLVSDTGSFRYMNTTPAVHSIASDLIQKGVSPLKVAQHLYEARSCEDLRFIGTVLRKIQQTPDGRIAWLEIPRKLFKNFHTSVDVLDELVNFPRSVQSAEVAFVMREAEEPGKIRVSFRSKGNVNVDLLARHFDGGGHIAASGCTIQGTLQQARNQILKVVRPLVRRPSSH